MAGSGDVSELHCLARGIKDAEGGDGVRQAGVFECEAEYAAELKTPGGSGFG